MSSWLSKGVDMIAPSPRCPRPLSEARRVLNHSGLADVAPARYAVGLFMEAELALGWYG